ncbi:3928_t:CDS:2 [Paraglomus occultum]|uniref:3928_t:CDS:1 n=1 Tax=Paraglomus occultum TaxID=144539 RepID=A0A9N8VTR7_9GLOM|nr:3928_t:CDS:2 [Paraglomus occultum]
MNTQLARVGMLVTDFDETVTLEDTTCEIAKLAYNKRARKNICPMTIVEKQLQQIQTSNDYPYPCPPLWSYFVNLYLKERADFIFKWRQNNPHYTLSDFYSLLSSLSLVENNSLDRVESYHCLTGICASELYSCGKCIPKRPGVVECIRSFVQKDNRSVYVLSTNWSTDLILGALSDVGVEKGIIMSNDLDFDLEGEYATGKITRKVVTGTDKLKLFKKLDISKGMLTVYVGDSDTDLPCLLAADVGIVMGNNYSLKKNCERLGIELVNGLSRVTAATNDKRELYRVKDWFEIKESGLLR